MKIKGIVTKLLTAFVVVALALGCTKDVTEDTMLGVGNMCEGETITLAVTTSRATLNGLNITLNEGDVISVNGTHAPLVREGGALTITIPKASDNIYRAIFPAQAADSYYLGGEAPYIHSNMQLYQLDSFGEEALPLAAYLEDDGENPQLQFKAMMGVLKLTIKGDAEIRSIRIWDNRLTSLIGSENYPYAMGGYCVPMNGDEAQSVKPFDANTTHFAPSIASTGLCPTITLLCNDGEGKGVKLSQSGTPFYIVVPARVYAQGFTVSVSSNDHLNQTLSTSGPTTVRTNYITAMQPFTYSPDEDLVFAENFDAMVYGSDIVTRRIAGSNNAMWRGRTPKTTNARYVEGVFASNEYTGLEIPYYYGVNGTATNYAGESVTITTPGAVYSNWSTEPAVSDDYSMELVKANGKLLASESHIRSRNMWDWWLSRLVEYDGYISIGSEQASISKYGLGGIYPRGCAITPKFTNMTSTSDVAVTFRVASCDNTSGELVRLLTYGTGAVSKVEFVDAQGNTVVGGYDGHDWEIVNGIWHCSGLALSPTEWRNVRAVISSASTNTGLRICSSTGGLKKFGYFIDDIEVRTIDSVQSSHTNIKGKVSCNGVGVADVVVSDGTLVTKTNADGEYFLVSDISKAQYLYISTPGGYKLTEKDGATPAFYKKINNSATGLQTFDFTLVKENQSDYTLLVMADSHVLGGASRHGSTEDKSKFVNLFKPKWNAHIASCKGAVYGVHLGDMTQQSCWKKYPLASYKSDVSDSPCPIYNVMGNHDHNTVSTGLDDTNQEQSRTSFTSSLGPAYYSFNIGTEHYVVLDNAFVNTSETDYVEGVDAKQMAWLKQDISLLNPEKVKGIVVLVHIPMTTNKGPRANYDAVMKTFKDWPVTVLSGHSHHDRRFAYTSSTSKRRVEYANPSLAGTAWLGDICYDGTPASFVEYKFSEGVDIARRVIPFTALHENSYFRVYSSTYTSSTYGGTLAKYTITPYAGLTDERAKDIENENSNAKGYGTSPAIAVCAWNAKEVKFISASGGDVYKESRYDIAYRDWFWASLASSNKNTIILTTANELPAWQTPKTAQLMWVYVPNSPTESVQVKAYDFYGNQLGETAVVKALE